MKAYALPLLAAVLLLFGSCKPKTYEVKRDLVIKAQPAHVYAQVINHKQSHAWSPWDAMDPDMEKTYEGPEEGVGAKYAWVGNEDVGTGYLEIIEATPHTYIKQKLVFTSPWESESVVNWHFEEADGGTKATWTVVGELPGYLFWMGQESMEEMMGPDFENGLAKLKEVAEAKANATASFKAELVEVESADYYYTKHTMAISDMGSEVYAENFSKLFSFLGPDAASVSAPPFAVFHEWNEEANQTTFEIALAAKSKNPANKDFMKGKTYAGMAFMVRYEGPYEASGQVHEFLHEHLTENGFDYAGNPWESYVVGPGQESDPNKWITEIYYPVKKKGEMS